MTRTKTKPEDIKATPEHVEPVPLEWFRSRMPLPLLLQAFFEDPGHRYEFYQGKANTSESACDRDTEMWDLLTTAEIIAERFELFDDPNAQEIVARLRGLTGCKGRLRRE